MIQQFNLSFTILTNGWVWIKQMIKFELKSWYNSFEYELYTMWLATSPPCSCVGAP